MGWWSNTKARRAKTNVSVPGGDMLGSKLGMYGKMVSKVTNWMLSWLWSMLSPAILSFPGLVILAIVIVLLVYDFIIKRIIKTIWLASEVFAHGGVISRMIARCLRVVAMDMKCVLDAMGYVVKATINAVMAAVKVVETGVTYGTTFFMQGGVAILSDKTELLNQAGTVAEKMNGSGKNDENNKPKKEVVVKYTDIEDYNVEVQRSETLKKYDMKAEMLQYSLRFGKYWNKALAVGEVKRELLEDYYNSVSGESSSAISETMTTMRDVEEKKGQIKDMYYYTYKTQTAVIKAKEEEIEKKKYTTEKELGKEKENLQKKLNEIPTLQEQLDELSNRPGTYTTLEGCREAKEKELENAIKKIESNYNSEKAELNGFTDECSKNIISAVGEEKKYNNAKGKYNNYVDKYNEEVSKDENLEKLEKLRVVKIDSLIDLKNEIDKYERNLIIREDNYDKSGESLKVVEGAFYGETPPSPSPSPTTDDTTADTTTGDTTDDSTNTTTDDTTDAIDKADIFENTIKEKREAEKINIEKIKNELSDLLSNIEEERTNFAAVQDKINEIENKQDKRNEININIIELDNRMSNLEYLNEEIKELYTRLQREKDKLYELFMGSELYFVLVEDGDSSNENKVDYIMDMYYEDEELFEDLKDSIKELLNAEVSNTETTFGRFVGTENGFTEMSINEALNKMIQNRYGGYGYPKLYYTAKNDGDDVLGAKVLTYEHTMITAPEDLKLLSTSMVVNPEDPGKRISCISFTSCDYQREYRVMGLEDISKFFNAKVKKKKGNEFNEITIDQDGKISVTQDYEVDNITIPEGTAIGSFGSKVVTLAERKAAAERENARNKQGKDANIGGYTSEKDLAIINDPHTYGHVFVELNESSKNSVLDIEPDFIIPVSNKGLYRYASTLKETEDGRAAKIYGGVVTASDPGIVQKIGFGDNGETITIGETTYSGGKTYNRKDNNIISFGDRQRELLYRLDPYWSSKQYKFDDDEPDVAKGQIMGKRYRDSNGKISDEYVIAPSGYRLAAKQSTGIGNFITHCYDMYDVKTQKIVTYTLNTAAGSTKGQSEQEMYKIDSNFAQHIDNVVKYKISDGDVIGYRIDSEASGNELKRKEVEVKFYSDMGKKLAGNIAVGSREYCDIQEVGRDKNGLLRVKLRNNKTSEVYEYIGLSGLGEKVVDKLNDVYGNQSSSNYVYGYEPWYKTNYSVSSTDGKFDAISKVGKGEGIAFVGRSLVRDSNQKLCFNEEDTKLDVIAPEDCILTKAGWDTYTGWTIQLTSLDYERRYTFSELSDFSNWIKGVIGSKVGPDWETKNYGDITIDEYRVIKKGEMVGRMGASRGPEVGDIPLIAPETLRVVRIGYKIDKKDESIIYCIKLESLDGTRGYEITDMDICNQIVHTGLNGDLSDTNKSLTIVDKDYEKIPYDNCYLSTYEGLSEFKSNEFYRTKIWKTKDKTGKEMEVARQIQIRELYVYEGETIGYAKMEPIIDTIQKLAGVRSKKLQTDITVTNKSSVTTSSGKPANYDAMIKKGKAKEFDLFDAVHVAVLIEKFDKLPFNTGEMEAKLITIDEVEKDRRYNSNGNIVDVFYISYTEAEHRATKAVCYDGEGNTLAVNEFNYETGNRKIESISYVGKNSIEYKANNIDKSRETNTFIKDGENVKVTTVTELPIYVPEGINKVSKIRLYDSVGMYQDYNINEILSVDQNEIGKTVDIKLLFAYDVGVQRIECYNGNNDLIGIRYNTGRDGEEEKKDSSLYTVKLNSKDKIEQIKIYTNTGEALYWKPEITSINKVNESRIEIKLVKGMKDIRESKSILVKNNAGDTEVYSIAGDMKYNKVTEQGYIIEEGEASIILNNSDKVRKIGVICTDESYTLYKCMSVDDVVIEKTGNVNIKFSISSGDELREIEIRSKTDEVLFKKEMRGSNFVDVVLDKEKVKTIGRIILRSKNGDNVCYEVDNKLCWAEIVNRNTIRVGCSIVDVEGNVRIVLKDDEDNDLGVAAVKDSLTSTVEIKLNDIMRTSEDVSKIVLYDGDKAKDVYTMLNVHSITDHGLGKYGMIIRQQKGIELDRFEFYDRYGNVKRRQKLGEELKNRYKYFKVDEGSTTLQGESNVVLIEHIVTLDSDEVGLVIYDKDNNSREVLIKPIITACRVTNKSRLKVEFYEGYGGVTNMEVIGKSTASQQEATLKSFENDSGKSVYKAKVSNADANKITVKIANEKGYSIDIIRIESDKKNFNADNMEKVVIKNGLGFSDEYEFFDVDSITVSGNNVCVVGRNMTDVSYVTVDGVTVAANKVSNDKYTLPVGEATKIIAKQVQKTYEGTYTREKVIDGPSIQSAQKVNDGSTDNVIIEVSATEGTKIARTSDNYQANIKYFNSDNNEITNSNLILGRTNVLRGEYAKNVYKVRVCNANGLVAEKVVEDKTMDEVELKVTGVEFVKKDKKTTLVATVDISDTNILEIVPGESGVIYNGTLSSVTVADGTNSREKKVSMDLDMSKLFSKLQITAEYRKDQNLKKATQYDLFKVNDISRVDEGIRFAIRNLGAIGVKEISYVGCDSTNWNKVDWAKIEGENMVIDRLAECAANIKITLNNGYTVEYGAPTVDSAKKVDGDKDKIMLEMDVLLTDVYDKKDMIDRIDLYDDDKNLLGSIGKVNGQEEGVRIGVSLELTNDQIKASKVRVITKGGFVVEKVLTDDTKAYKTITVDSVEATSDGYKINIKKPMSEADISKVIFKKVNEEEIEKSCSDGKVGKVDNVYSVRVLDSDNNSSNWYDLVTTPELKKIDGGVKVVFERNLFNVVEIIWVDKSKTLRSAENIGNVIEYTIPGDGISNVSIKLDNGKEYILEV